MNDNSSFSLEMPLGFPDLRDLVPEEVANAAVAAVTPAPAPTPAPPVQAAAPDPVPQVTLAPVDPLEANPVPKVDIGPAVAPPFNLRDYLLQGRGAHHIERLNPDFRGRIEALLLEAPPEVRSALKLNSGFRFATRAEANAAGVSPSEGQTQDELYADFLDKKAKGIPVALTGRPGYSHHNHGRAFDLLYDGERDPKTPAGKAARDWVHANAQRFDLHFPMGSEPWHIEPRWARGMSTAKLPSRTLDVISDVARETGADAGFLKALGFAESNMNPTARAKTSSAGGLYQFTDPTWNDNMRRYGALYGIQGLDKFDVRASTYLAAKNAKDNYDAVERVIGRSPNYAEQYSAWVLGRGGGPRFLKALAMSPDAPAYASADHDQVAANRSLFFAKDGRPYSNKELYGIFEKKMTPQDVSRDLAARTDPTAPISPHDVWAAPPLPLDRRYTDAALEAKRMFHREQSMGFWQGYGQSMTTTELTARGIRALTTKGFAPDAGYIGSEDHKADIEALSKDLPAEYLDRFGAAVSQKHLVEIARQARVEADLIQKLDEAGWKGTLARVAAAVTDPASLLIGGVSGGLGTELATIGKMARMSSKLVAAGAGAAGNVATEAAIDSLAGQKSEVSHLAMSAALGATFGAIFGPIGRNRALQQEALALENEAQQMLRAPLQDIEVNIAPVVPTPGGEAVASSNVIPFPARGASAGAAVNQQAVPERLSDPLFRGIQQDSVPRTAMEAARLSSGGQAAASENPITRVGGGLLGVDMVGKEGLAANPNSADQDMARYFRTRQYQWRSYAKPAYEEWAKDEGYNFVERSFGRGWQEFNERVAKWVRERDPAIAAQEHAAVQRAGQQFRQMMKEMADDQRNPWKAVDGRLGGSVAGAEGLEFDPHYVMRVWSVTKMQDAIERFGHNGVVRVIGGAIKKMQPDVDDDLALKFANAIVTSRYTRLMGYDERLDRALSGADTAIMAQMLRDEFRWTEDEIRRIMSQLRKSEPNLPPHLKHRIQLDEGYRMKDVNGYGTGELAISDLLENHADLLMNYYSRKAAGRVALARQRFDNPLNGDVVVDGIRSDADFEKIIQAATRWYEDNPHVPPEKAKKELDTLRWMYDRIKGVPDPAQLGDWADWLRVARNYNFARMMGQVGFAQLMDAPRIMATVGIKSFMQQMRGFRRIVNEMDGQSMLRHGLDHELEAMFGLGTDRLRGFVALVWEEAGQVRSASRGRLVDKAGSVTEGLANMTAEVSGMHYINSWLQLMVGRAAAQKFATMAAGRISKSDMRQLRFIGLDDAMLNRVLAAVRDPNTGFTHEEGLLFGRRVAKMNLDRWTDIEARAAFERALFRWSRHIVQENDIGSLHRIMSHPIAQVLMQFRSYSMTAWENQLLHGLANWQDPRTFAQASSTLLGASLVYAAQVHLQAIGRSDADDFLEKKLAPGAFAAAVFQRAGWSSLVPMGVDTITSFTPIGPIFDARVSGQPTDFIFGNPLGSFGSDLQKSTKGILDSVWNNRQLTQAELRALSRLFAFQNTMPIIQAYSLMIGNQPLTK